jgi:hypothetical protein
VQEFDDIFIKEKVKKYGKHEIHRPEYKRKKNRERSYGKGRPFKFDIETAF